MSTIPQLSNVRAIRAEILVDGGLNSRQTPDDTEQTKIRKLADSMKVQGVLHPPILMRTSQAGKDYKDKAEPYLLIAGFRRHAAMGELGQTEGDYRLAPATWGLKEAMAANMVENLQREDLSSYDVAMQCARIAEDFKMTGGEVAKMIRAYDSDPEGKQALSEQHVNNLIRCARKLHPSMLKAWKEGHPKASMRTLIKIAGSDEPSEQLKDWKALTEPKTKGEGNGAGGGKDKDGKKPRKRPTEAQVIIMIERVKDSDKADDWKRGALDALKWAAGTTEKIPGVKWEADSKGKTNGKAEGKGKGGRRRKGADVGEEELSTDTDE